MPRRPWIPLLMTALLAQAVQAKVIERIVAVVNSDIILLSELELRVRPMMPQLQQIPDPQMRAQKLEELRRQLLNHMIDEKLIVQQAKKLKLEVSDADLERAVADVMKKNSLTRDELEAALRQEGQTLHSYKYSILKPQLLRLRVLNVQVRSRVNVSDDEVRALYQKNLRQLGVETKVRARHIFVLVPQGASPREVARRKQLAQQLLKRVRQPGADFGAIARKFSQDPVTREDGGDLGEFGRGTLPAQIEDAVFALKKGQISDVLRADRGFHIIQVQERKESAARSFDEVKDQLRQEMYSKKLERTTKAWLVEIRKRSHIDIK
jgi:peptidyl-prolyl cis-trans isomerase SurA